jgi:hypothetical protein
MPDVRRASRRDHVGMIDSGTATIAIRVATPADDEALDALSRLDSARKLLRPALIASVDGRPAAALSLTDDRVVADPFRPTDDVVLLLRARRAALRHGAPVAPRRRTAPMRFRSAL